MKHSRSALDLTEEFTTINILMVHGVEGFPEKNWYSQLKKELEKSLGDQKIKLRIVIPQFPTQIPDEGKRFLNKPIPEELKSYNNQTFEDWLPIAQEAMEEWNPEQTIIVGHSLGGGMGFRLTELAGKAGKPFLAFFGVCPVCGPIGLPECGLERLETFYKDVDEDMVRAGAKEICVFVGEGDTDVPPEQSEAFAKKCRANKIETIPNGKHLNAQSDPRAVQALVDKLVQQIGAIVIEGPSAAITKRAQQGLHISPRLGPRRWASINISRSYKVRGNRPIPRMTLLGE